MRMVVITPGIYFFTPPIIDPQKIPSRGGPRHRKKHTNLWDNFSWIQPVPYITIIVQPVPYITIIEDSYHLHPQCTHCYMFTAVNGVEDTPVFNYMKHGRVIMASGDGSVNFMIVIWG